MAQEKTGRDQRRVSEMAVRLDSGLHQTEPMVSFPKRSWFGMERKGSVLTTGDKEERKEKEKLSLLERLERIAR
jgi:hypothetical protein